MTARGGVCRLLFYLESSKVGREREEEGGKNIRCINNRVIVALLLSGHTYVGITLAPRSSRSVDAENFTLVPILGAIAFNSVIVHFLSGPILLP